MTSFSVGDARVIEAKEITASFDSDGGGNISVYMPLTWEALRFVDETRKQPSDTIRFGNDESTVTTDARIREVVFSYTQDSPLESFIHVEYESADNMSDFGIEISAKT